ncbi:MAG: GGDEF domain-containing protein [Spirochaetaceae bacterium JB067]
MIDNIIPRKIFELYHNQFSDMPLMVVDLDGIITYCNKALIRRLRLPETPKRKEMSSLIQLDLSMTDPLFEDIDSRITVNLISTSIVSNGEHIHIRGHVFYDGNQYVIIFNTYKQDYEQILEQVNQLNAQMSSITRDSVKQYKLKSRQAEKNLDLALHDQLTKLANRRLFIQILSKAMAAVSEKDSKLSAGIILFDIDNFKDVNDNYGHDSGDQVLIKLSRTVENTIRKHDTLSRYGGEEFIILVYCDALDELAKMAEKIRHTVETTEFPFLKSPLTASFGITMIEKDETPGHLIKRADEAMYTAKRKGKNQVSSL